MFATDIRPATNADIAALVTLENASFDSDRLSRRSFRYFLQHAQNCFLVAYQGQTLAGYVLALLHRGTHLARIYSLAVDTSQRGRGIAQQLLEYAEKACAENGRVSMRLEVRTDNDSAIRLYQRLGYKPFGEYKDYYEDHADALRLQKRILHPTAQTTHVDVPYYPQHTDFTCGPAALMMGMAALSPQQTMSMSEELGIWRESTTIYMMAGHGGCSPVGLALAAIRRGYSAATYLSSTETPFIDSVRDEDKKQVIEQVHQDFLHQLAEQAAPVHYTNITQVELEAALEQGHVPLVLISTYRFDHKKTPHWVVVAAIDKRFIYIHDPYINEPDYRFALDNQYLPISRSDFDKMSQFGQSRLRTAVIIGRRV